MEVKLIISDLNKKDYFKFDHSRDVYAYLGYSKTVEDFGDFYSVFNTAKQRLEVIQHNTSIVHLGTYSKLVIK